MAENQIQKAIRDGLEPVGGTIQDLAIERRQWLSTLVSDRSVLEIRLIEGGVVAGLYVSHDDTTITISNSTDTKVIRFMEIDGIDQIT